MTTIEQIEIHIHILLAKIMCVGKSACKQEVDSAEVDELPDEFWS